MTRRSLSPANPLLVGPLSARRVSPAGQPYVAIAVWCPYCKRRHEHGWDPESRRSHAVSHRAAHCDDGSPLCGGGYFIGPDPAHAAANRAALDEFDADMRRWQARVERLAAATA
jgi:hypothetical protein